MSLSRVRWCLHSGILYEIDSLLRVQAPWPVQQAGAVSAASVLTAVTCAELLDDQRSAAAARMHLSALLATLHKVVNAALPLASLGLGQAPCPASHSAALWRSAAWFLTP